MLPVDRAMRVSRTASIADVAATLVRRFRSEDPLVTARQQARRIFGIEQRHAGALAAGSREAPAPLAAFIGAVLPHVIVRLFTGDTSGRRSSS